MVWTQSTEGVVERMMIEVIFLIWISFLTYGLAKEFSDISKQLDRIEERLKGNPRHKK